MHKALRIAGLMLAVMVVVVMAVAPASAAPALQGGGNGSSGNGGTGMNNWQTLQSGQRVEYIFTSTGNNDSATVELASNPQGAVQFNVFTEDQWNSGATTILGKGTTQATTDKDTGVTTTRNNGSLNWTTATSGGGQRYHIQVYSTSQQPAQYWINASGTGVGSLAAFNANARNASLQGQSAQGTSANAGASTSSNAGATSSTNAGTSAGGGATGNNNNLPAPRTLPRTGGSDLAVLFAAAAAALITGGWLARRRTS